MRSRVIEVWPALLLGLFLAAGQIRAAPPPSADGSSRAVLQLVPLETPGAVVTKADASKADARIYNGVLLPSSALQFGQGFKEYGLTVAGTRLSLSQRGQEFALLSGSKRIVLKQNGMSMAPVTLPTASGGQYILAFPYGYASGANGTLWPRSGGVQRGTIGGQVVSIFDDNTDGRYRIGDDSLRIGSPDAAVNVFAPISRFVATPEKVYEIRSLAEDGSALEYVEYAGPTAKLSVACAMPESQICVVLSSKDAQLNLVATATPQSPAVLTVIPGHYDVTYGGVYSTKTHRLVALVAPGSSSSLDVAVEQATRFEVGSPLKLEFTVNKPDRSKISIESGSFRVKGKAGEEYKAYTWLQTEPPTVSARRGSTTISIGKMSFG